eukprot:scaffold7738_cov107-Isochrysis_galbana.AAC.22
MVKTKRVVSCANPPKCPMRLPAAPGPLPPLLHLDLDLSTQSHSAYSPLPAAPALRLVLVLVPLSLVSSLSLVVP